MRAFSVRHTFVAALATPTFAGVLACALSGAIGCGGSTTSSSANGANGPADASGTTTGPDAGRSGGSTQAQDSGSPPEDAGSGVTSVVDAASAACVLAATDYDQSCAVDSDCVEITAGDYCNGGPQCMCGGSTISASALTKFESDVARVYDGGHGIACPCAALEGPCCRRGACTTQCWAPSDTLPACADAGGMCIPPNVGCGSAGGGPPPTLDGGCAFPDETCCL